MASVMVPIQGVEASRGAPREGLLYRRGGDRMLRGLPSSKSDREHRVFLCHREALFAGAWLQEIGGKVGITRLGGVHSGMTRMKRSKRSGKRLSWLDGTFGKESAWRFESR